MLFTMKDRKSENYITGIEDLRSFEFGELRNVVHYSKFLYFPVVVSFLPTVYSIYMLVRFTLSGDLTIPKDDLTLTNILVVISALLFIAALDGMLLFGGWMTIKDIKICRIKFYEKGFFLIQRKYISVISYNEIISLKCTSGRRPYYIIETKEETVTIRKMEYSDELEKVLAELPLKKSVRTFI